MKWVSFSLKKKNKIKSGIVMTMREINLREHLGGTPSQVGRVDCRMQETVSGPSSSYPLLHWKVQVDPKYCVWQSKEPLAGACKELQRCTA